MMPYRTPYEQQRSKERQVRAMFAVAQIAMHMTGHETPDEVMDWIQRLVGNDQTTINLTALLLASELTKAGTNEKPASAN